MKKRILLFVLCLTGFVFIFPGAFTQESKFNIGLKTGIFNPSDWMIQGYKNIYYNIDGSPTSLAVSGFGLGNEMLLNFKYFSGNSGIELTSGLRISKRDVTMALEPNGWEYMYENTLTVFPIEFSYIQRLPVGETRIIPYLGTGIGVYISKWETKYYPENGTRNWEKSSKVPVGIIFNGGFSFPLYHAIRFDFGINYSYCVSNWDIENEDDNSYYRIEELNTGGISTRFGLVFEF